jgi:putative tricarboxylic transport membrane protein
MFEYVYPLILGSLAGVFAGLMPGIGNFICLIIMMPLLWNMNPLEILIVYVGLVSISQYVASVPATVLGLVSEPSSMPVVRESSKLTTTEMISNSISGAALGSFFGSMVVVILCYWFHPQLIKIFTLYSTGIQVMVLLLVVVIVCFVNQEPIWQNYLQIFCGLILGLVGYNSILHTPILTFGNVHLFGGLPTVIVVIMLFGLPQLCQNYNSKLKNKIKISEILVKSPSRYPSIISSFFYSVVGFIGGLVPGLTNILSSKMAYFFSTKFTSDPVKRIWASETANNAGAFSQLLPLIMLGIPLTTSEAFLINLIEVKGLTFHLSSLGDIITIVSYHLVIINLIGLIIAWPMAKYLLYFFHMPLKYFYIFISFVLISCIFYIGWINNAITFHILCFFIFLPIFYLLRNKNTMPLIFGFLLADQLLSSFYRLYFLITF